LSTVVEEADESVFWMEILVEADIINQNEVKSLMSEGNEILKVISSARKTVSKNK
jgi:four helix bundle protein